MTSKDEKVFVVPGTEIRVTIPWLNLIVFCQDEVPYGEVTVKIVNGQPTLLVRSQRDIRFDKDDTIPKKYNEDLSQK